MEVHFQVQQSYQIRAGVSAAARAGSLASFCLAAVTIGFLAPLSRQRVPKSFVTVSTSGKRVTVAMGALIWLSELI